MNFSHLCELVESFLLKFLVSSIESFEIEVSEESLDYNIVLTRLLRSVSIAPRNQDSITFIFNVTKIP